MKRLLLAVLCALPSFLSAESYVTPVATARVKDRVYSTTTSFINSGSLDVSCEAIYALPTGGTLRAHYQLPAGNTIVEEDTLIAAGAIGTMRFVCTGPAVIAARILTSVDGGRTFDKGRIFPAASEADAIAEGTNKSVKTTTDLLVMEVAGRRTPFEITVRDRLGATVGAKKYDIRPFAQEVINLSKILPVTPTVTVEINVAKDAGSLVVSRPTTDPRFVATRPATPHIVAASFKAAPFRDPVTGLVYMRDRWYDPSTGSFLTPDAEGFGDSPNPYAYCGGDPVNCSDPTGRAASLSLSGWILATDNGNGRRIRRFSPEDVANDPIGVRRFLGLRAEITAIEADDIMFRAGYGAWFGNQAGIYAAAIGTESAKPVVEATATSLWLMGNVTTVGGIAQVTQALLDHGPTKSNVAMAGVAFIGLGASDDVIRLGTLSNDLQSGITTLRQFDIDRYGAFNTGARRGDELAGHEMLQNAWLKAKGYITRSRSGRASRDNPAVALSRELHEAVGREQAALGLNNPAKLASMTAEENILLNELAMRRAGIPEHVVQTLKSEALKHVAGLQ